MCADSVANNYVTLETMVGGGKHEGADEQRRLIASLCVHGPDASRSEMACPEGGGRCREHDRTPPSERNADSDASSGESTCESADPADFESALAMSSDVAAAFNVAAYSKLPSPDRPELIYFPALFMYDYVLTLTREVDFFWNQPRRTCAFALFIANRYIALFGRVPAFLENFLFVSGGPDSPVRVVRPSRTTH